MGAARDEGDVGARLGQCRAKSAADSAGADNRNTHEFLRLTAYRLHSDPVQGAELVAVGIAQIGDIEI